MILASLVGGFIVLIGKFFDSHDACLFRSMPVKLEQRSSSSEIVELEKSEVILAALYEEEVELALEMSERFSSPTRLVLSSSSNTAVGAFSAAEMV